MIDVAVRDVFDYLLRGVAGPADDLRLQSDRSKRLCTLLDRLVTLCDLCRVRGVVAEGVEVFPEFGFGVHPEQDRFSTCGGEDVHGNIKDVRSAVRILDGDNGFLEHHRVQSYHT